MNPPDNESLRERNQRLSAERKARRESRQLAKALAQKQPLRERLREERQERIQEKREVRAAEKEEVQKTPPTPLNVEAVISRQTRLGEGTLRGIPNKREQRVLGTGAENIGEEREIFNEDESSSSLHQFRTLKQLAGGASVIKPLDDPDEKGETVDFKAFKVISGVPAAFNEDDDDIVELEFTGADGTFKLGASGIATTQKGLVSSITPVDGWYGELRFEHADGVPGFHSLLVLTVVNGSIVAVDNQNGTDPLSSVPGTEGSPGNAQFNSRH